MPLSQYSDPPQTVSIANAITITNASPETPSQNKFQDHDQDDTISVPTPPASDWTDLTINDGAGSDEGDTFKYECKECELVFASIIELTKHLRESEMHVVCKICLKEFSGSQEEKEEKKKVHLEEHIESEDLRAEGGEEKLGGVDLPVDAAHGPSKFDGAQETSPTSLSRKSSTSSLACHVNATPSHGQEQQKQVAEVEDTKIPTGPTSPVRPTKMNESPGQLQKPSNVLYPYYHWEPETFYEEMGYLNLGDLVKERRKELVWLRTFEGA